MVDFSVCLDKVWKMYVNYLRYFARSAKRSCRGVGPLREATLSKHRSWLKDNGRRLWTPFAAAKHWCGAFEPAFDVPADWCCHSLDAHILMTRAGCHYSRPLRRRRIGWSAVRRELRVLPWVKLPKLVSRGSPKRIVASKRKNDFSALAEWENCHFKSKLHLCGKNSAFEENFVCFNFQRHT